MSGRIKIRINILTRFSSTLKGGIKKIYGRLKLKNEMIHFSYLGRNLRPLNKTFFAIPQKTSWLGCREKLAKGIENEITNINIKRSLQWDYELQQTCQP